MKLNLLVAAAALAVSLPAAAIAQDAMAPLDPASVTREDPFGEIDVSAAMGAGADIGAWAGALTPEQRAELTARCDVISADSANYEADAVTFCSTYGTWDEANPAQ